MKKVLDILNKSKVAIITIIGILTALLTVISSVEDVAEAIPSKDSTEVSIAIDSLPSDSL